MRRSLLALPVIALLILGTTVYLSSGTVDGRVVDQGPLPERSIYQLRSVWTGADGEDVSLESLRGRPQLVSMVFTRCGFACPMLVSDLKRVLDAVPAKQRRDVGVVLVSIDPEHDDLEALRQFAETHRLDPAQWTLLRGDAASVRELAAVLGVRYKAEDGGQIAHTNLIALLDAGGEIVQRQEGLSGSVEAIADAVSAAAGGR